MEPFTKRSRMNPIRISIEGNIATGKSTFIKILEEAGEDWEITPEPVATWTKVDSHDKSKNKKDNILYNFYKDPKRWAYTFESLTFTTRMNIEKQRRRLLCQKSASIIERSVLASKYIFARNCFETGLMTDTEWSIYQDWSTYLLDSLGELSLDGIIYLRADPKVCAGRMAKRGRVEEQGVSLEYLTQLHDKHEAWLHDKKFHSEDIMDGIPILEIDCNKEFHDDKELCDDMLQQVREFVEKCRSKSQSDDSGVESYSRSISPCSVSPLPFEDKSIKNEMLNNSENSNSLNSSN